MKNFIFQNSPFFLLFLLALQIPNIALASATDGTIDSTYKYAWSEKIGWINFGTSGGNVHVTDSGLTGSAWNETFGWIKLNPSTSGVSNNGEGVLSGSAWGEGVGWIDFSGVSIDSSGYFSGYASGTATGQISFNCSNTSSCGLSDFKTRTDWRPQSARTTTTSTPTPSSGGGGVWISPPPTEPEGGFKILINDNAAETDSRKITLILKGGSNTRVVWISENSQFSEGFQVSYDSSSPQVYVSFNLSEGEDVKTVYAKFCTQWSRCSEIVSDNIVYKKKISLVDRILDILEPITPEFLKPKPPEIKPVEISVEELTPKEAPLSMKSGWTLLSYTLYNKPFINLTLAPLPKEIRSLAEKFPELEKTLKDVGVSKLIDVEKLKTVRLSLPGLTKKTGSSGVDIVPGKFALPKGLPIVKLSPQMKQQLPTEIVFAKTGSGLIDFDIALTIAENGRPQQKISTISGKPLQLVVKPDKPVKSVKGYVVFKAKPSQSTSLELPLNSLLASVLFANPVFAKPQEQPVRVEEKLVLLEFEYTDPDGDGIYTAEIQAPAVEGEYEIITVMNFEDPELGAKEIRLTAVVDPEGYVYEKDGDKETRVPGAIVSLFWLNPETKQYELWPAKEYQQENPQITDVRGTYSFLVPEGNYYLKVEAPGYPVYDGKSFQVREGSGVHINIELKSEYWWLKVVDWKFLALIAVILLLLYNFYRDRLREKYGQSIKS